MRALTWLLGMMVVLIGFELRASGSSSWTAVWIGAAVLWFFVGCALLVMWVAKLASGKMGAGLNAALTKRSQGVPAPQVKHDG